ncbi:acyl-CoA thioesterase [Metabacillus herbersteinensis]|uniref:Acyl-CoA thioesterase n=1 Tax=Metabacillus herbersteinensis TaxID=283816 RepID=A0ABV6GAG1_9BACI
MYETSVRVRFGETDALGHVNNTSYFIYLEDARVQFFEKLGYSMDSNNWQFILASTKCDFVGQAYFNQRLRTTTSVSKIGTKSFTLEHSIIDEKTENIIATANAVIVYFNFETQKSEAIPETLRESLESHFCKV